MKYPFTKIVASRSLELTSSDGTKKTAMIHLGAPTLVQSLPSGNRKFYCSLQAIGVGSDEVLTVFGADEVQALRHAMEMAGTLLTGSPANRLKRLSWFDVPNFGFPFTTLQLPAAVLKTIRANPSAVPKLAKLVQENRALLSPGTPSVVPVAPPSKARFELYEDAAREWRWRLRHQNGNILADSGEGYSTKRAARNGIASVQKNALSAPVEETASP